jgi:hypothetical protein
MLSRRWVVKKVHFRKTTISILADFTVFHSLFTKNSDQKYRRKKEHFCSFILKNSQLFLIPKLIGINQSPNIRNQCPEKKPNETNKTNPLKNQPIPISIGAE